MKFRGWVTVVILLVGVTATIIHFKHLYGSQATRSILVNPDRSFSKTIQESMISFAKEQEKITTSSAVLSDIIQDTFPAVEKVQILTEPDGRIKIKVWPHKPIALINDQKLLTKQGGLLQKTDLQETISKHLPSVKITVKDEVQLQVSPALQRFISRTNSDIYKQYEITWFDETHIELRDKNEKQFVLLASDQTLFTENLLRQYTQLKEGVTRAARAPKTKNWYVDVRFKNQIVIFAQKGERG